MKDFIYNLYQNDNFTLYLTIALVILVILFVIVLIFGKKDQKLEETKKLQKLELEGFKEEKTEPVKVEVMETPEVVPEKVEEVKDLVVEEPGLEKQMEEEIEVTTFEPETKVEEETNVDSVEHSEETVSEFVKDGMPLFSTTEESTLTIPDYNLGDLEAELDEIAEMVPEISDTETTENNVYNEAQTTGTPVFSSVFVNNDANIPTNNEEQKMSVFAMDDDDDTIELPTLKVEKEVKEETPIIKADEEQTFSFDDISGETYDIK